MHFVSIWILNKSLGKPGYGKTVLSSRIIRDLQDRITEEDGPTSTKAVVAYFHFNNRQREFRAGGDALRAVLAQIIKSAGLAQTSSI